MLYWPMIDIGGKHKYLIEVEIKREETKQFREGWVIFNTQIKSFQRKTVFLYFLDQLTIFFLGYFELKVLWPMLTIYLLVCYCLKTENRIKLRNNNWTTFLLKLRILHIKYNDIWDAIFISWAGWESPASGLVCILGQSFRQNCCWI